MLKREDFLMIQEKVAKGVYLKDIAAELGVHPKTVRRALERGGAPSGKRPKTRESKLGPFKATVDRLLSEDVWNAVVILRVIQGEGYTGEISMLRKYIRPKRPLRASRATVRFETAPGEQLQHDWGQLDTHIGGERCRVHVAVNTLGYSRRFHVFAALCEDAEHTYESLVRAFEYFGGVTDEVLVDNQKSAVIEHRIGQAVRFNPRFLDLAGQYGFRPRACRPYRARTKGKDERMVGYVKHHFFVRYRHFESLAHINQLLEQWLHEEADRRVHGTVKEVVTERFAREAPALGPLPAVRFDTAYLERRWAAWDGYVDVRGNRYSVPDAWRGQLVTVRIPLDGRLLVHGVDGEVIAEHRLRAPHQGWSTLADHHAQLWRETLAVERRDLTVYEEAAQWN
jgi:transposase